MSLCSQCGTKPSHARGLCATCYARLRRQEPYAAQAHRDANARYKKNNPEKRLELERRHKLKLTKDQYRFLVDRAGGACEICGSFSTKLCMDHDHRTKWVRGVLCDRCNRLLGLFERALRRLRAFKFYSAITAYFSRAEHERLAASSVLKGNAA
jgi:hypothetical protein